MKAVNLLPKDEGRKSSAYQNNNPLLVTGIAGAVLVTAILAAWFMTASGGVADNQRRRDAVQAQLAATPVPQPTSAGTSALDDEKSARITALSAALSGRLAWDRVLREVSLVLPDDVWLANLSAQAPAAGASPTASTGFTINGRTYSHDGVARLLERLSIVPHLTNVQLQHSSITTSETGRKVVEFTINAVVKAAGSA